MSVLSEISARELLVPLVAAPLIGALLCIFLKKRVSDVVAAIFAAITLVLALGAIGGVFGNLGSTITVPLGRLAMLGGETGQAPLVFELSIDALSALMLFMVTVIGFLVVVYSSEYLSPNNVEHPAGENKGRYYAWIVSGNFLQMFIFWELTTICSWALISHYQDEASLRAGFKALIMTAIGGLFFMLGLRLPAYWRLGQSRSVSFLYLAARCYGRAHPG